MSVSRTDRNAGSGALPLALGDALTRYEGTAFVVSHDRDLIDTFATRIFAFTPKGLVDLQGTYDEFLVKHADDYRPRH